MPEQRVWTRSQALQLTARGPCACAQPRKPMTLPLCPASGTQPSALLPTLGAHLWATALTLPHPEPPSVLPAGPPFILGLYPMWAWESGDFFPSM